MPKVCGNSTNRNIACGQLSGLRVWSREAIYFISDPGDYKTTPGCISNALQVLSCYQKYSIIYLYVCAYQTLSRSQNKK